VGSLVHRRGRHVVQRQPGVFDHRAGAAPAQPGRTAHLLPLRGQRIVAVVGARPVLRVGEPREHVGGVEVTPGRPAAPPAALEQQPVAAAPPPPPLAAPALPPPAPQNVVRTASRTYYLPAVPQAQADLDVYYELRSTCYASARGNSDGQLPGLQQAACQRYSDFARAHGWDTGPLPAYAAPAPREVGEQVTVIGQAQAVDGGQCAALYAEEQSIEARMRAGYQEPLGNWLRERKRAVEDRLWQLHCPRL